MKEKLMRFMQGRYGVDPFCKFLLIAGLVVVFLSAVLGGSVVGMILYVIGWILIIYCYFRMFSRNISKRYAEEEYMEAEERLSYLYMSRLQAEDPHSERKRPDRDPVSQVRKDVYKEKLTGVVP